MLCPTPAVGTEAHHARVKVDFLLDNLHFDFNSVGSGAFSYELNPRLYPLNQNDPSKPYHHKPGSIISVEVSVTSHFCYHNSFSNSFSEPASVCLFPVQLAFSNIIIVMI